MRDDQLAQMKSDLRQFGEEAIQASDVKLLQLIKRAINEAGIIRPGAIPILPPNAHGTINDESVAVAITGYSGITNLEEMLIYILAGLSAPPLAVQEADGTPSGTVSTIIWPNGSLAVDDDSDTATLTFPSGATITELDDVPDVNAPAPSDGDLLAWDAGAIEWVNVPVTATSGRYQMYVLTTDGMGGFNFVTDIDGNLVTTLEYLE